MSFNLLVQKLATPHVALNLLGASCSAWFFVGNTTTSFMGALPFAQSQQASATTKQKLQGWQYNYDYGKIYLAGAATLGGLFYTAATLLRPVSAARLGPPLVVAAVSSFSQVLFTLGFMLPTNNKLMAWTESTKLGKEVSISSREVDETINRWRNFNAVRIFFGAIAYTAGMSALLLAM